MEVCGYTSLSSERSCTTQHSSYQLLFPTPSFPLVQKLFLPLLLPKGLHMVPIWGDTTPPPPPFPALSVPLFLTWREEEMPEITVVHTKQVPRFHGDMLSNIVSVDLALFPFLPQFWSLPACYAGLKACPQGDARQSWGTTVSSAPGKGFKPQESFFFFFEATTSCRFPSFSLVHIGSE